MRRGIPMTSTKNNVLVSPTALVLSMLHTGAAPRLPIAIARSREDFMRRVLRDPPRVAVIGRGYLQELDLRRIALRRAVSPSPRMLLVLGRDEEPTAFERSYFDAIVVAGQVFMKSAKHLQHLVGVPAGSSTPPPPPTRRARPAWPTRVPVYAHA
jgi:hypothetical protein